ncbi:MAG TPA: hypothetical protein PK006_02265 [Saprospiraceae bacterium]|nr:hypothetical protein [Saprospiraceae bacterium]
MNLLKKSIPFFLLFCLSSFQSFTQHNILLSLTDTKSKALAQILSCNSNPLNGIVNPVQLGGIEKNSVNAHVINYFSIPGLYGSTVDFSTKLNSKSGLGIFWATDGSKELKENLFSAQWAFNLNSKSSLGIQTAYLLKTLPETKNQNGVLFTVSALHKFSSVFTVGFITKNPLPIQSKQLISVGSLFAVGVNYRALKQCYILLEIQKQSSIPMSYHVAMEYSPIPILDTRIGFQTRTNSFSFGLAYLVKHKLKLEAFGAYQFQLGFTSGAGVTYLWDRK